MMRTRYTRRRWTCRIDSKQRRGGYTLFEMMAVFAMLAAFLAASIVLLGLLLRAESSGYEAVASQQTLARLSRQLRSDAHSARSASAAAEPAGAIVLQGEADASVLWSAQGDTVQRVVRRGGSPAGRDSFQIPEGAVQLTIAADGAVIELRGRRPRSRLISVPDAAPEQHAQQIVIQAAVGITAEVAASRTQAAELEPEAR